MMTTATMEPTMTLKEAEGEIQQWQDKLQQAQAGLANHEQQIGQIALAQGAEQATQSLMRLQVEVRMAEAGLQAAQAQREAVQRREQSERAVQLRAEAAQLEEQAEEAGAFYSEWSPKVEAAYNKTVYLSQRALQIQRQADDIERKYGQVPA